MKTKTFNKVYAVVTAMLILFLLPLSLRTSTVAEASSTRSYYVYNAQSGTRLTSRNYTLNALSAPNSNMLTSVIGTDDRVIDYSKSGVVKLMSSSGYIGSGFVVDSHTVATAAHCVADSASSGISISEIRVFNSDSTIALHATPVESHVPAAYFSTSGSQNKYDYALITVEEDLSAYNTFYLGATTDAIFGSSMAVSVTGFPHYVNGNTVNDHNNDTMYTGSSIINSTNADGLLYYSVDTSGGNSGGPVYRTKQYKGNVYNTVIAIHTNGASYNMPYNHGTRITADILQFLLHNSNIQY